MDGNNWTEKHGKLYRRFKFDDFAKSLEFVSKIGELAEKAEHHPDISFGWGYVEVYLFTHSENKITTKDKSLAKKIEDLY